MKFMSRQVGEPEARWCAAADDTDANVDATTAATVSTTFPFASVSY